MSGPLADDLARDGWSRLEPLGDVVEALRSLVVEVSSHMKRYREFEELWDCQDRTLWRETQSKISCLLSPAITRWLPDHRPVMCNFWVKRARSPRTVVRYHRDPSVIDERRGKVALQLWIPLVDVDASNGGLILVNGSHVTGPSIRPHGYIDEMADRSVTSLPPGAVQPHLRAGEGVVFTNRSLHGSPGNRSDRDRPAVGAILAPVGEELISWVARDESTRELWGLTTEQFAELRPGSVPDGAVFRERIRVA